MRILVTGASGFIGGFLVEEALNKGWEVWVGTRKTSNKTYLTNPDLHLIELKYEDPDALLNQIKTLTNAVGKWDYIIHNAGITKASFDIDYERINYTYTVHLINALVESGSVPDKFLYMSSMGAVGPGDEKSGHPLTLKDKPNPISAYGKSKFKAEQYIQALSDFPYIILRPTGVYGPRERDYYVMLKMIKAGIDVSIGLKKQLLNFIYIKDLIQVCYIALESPLKNKIWFVADGDIYSSKEFTSIIKEVLQKRMVLSLSIPLPIVKVVSIVSGFFSRLTGSPALLNADKYKVMKQRNWTCDASSLTNDLNFTAKHKLQEGLKETVIWYKENGWL